MTVQTQYPLAALYLEDETAWLEEMARLIENRRLADLDYENLREFLEDMAKRDRREVKSRLTVLLAHLLKWEHQPENRTGSWRATIITPRQELADSAARGVLRNHAEAVLGEAYANAVERAAAETGLPGQTFAQECPYTVQQLLEIELPADEE
jgi:hypothetical protein